MKKQSTKQFIIDATLIHGDKYDYSKVVYENNLKEVIIICKEHGDFLQLPKTHKRGNGCKDCGRIRTVNARKGNTIDFIQKSIIIHGEAYIYSKVEYIKANQKVIIICKEHSDFLQTPNCHLDGKGCRNCSTKINSDKQRKTTDQFIQKSINIHENNYDYSKVEYVNNHTDVIIICKIHGEFLQSPAGHLVGKGCKLCSIISRSIKRTKSTEDFIEEAIKIHGDAFDYYKTIYSKCDENIIIICKEHGEFQQSPTSHLNGSICCPKCVLDKIGKWNNSNVNEFVEKAIIIHGDTYIYSKVDYKKSIEKVIIICKLHGEFEITPNSHLNGSGCYYCGKLTMVQKQTFTKEEFIQKSINIHENNYDYSKVEYVNNHTKILIVCKKHGIFEQTPQGHLSGRGCIKCSKIGYSKSSIKYLDFISKYNNIFIQHALNDKEYIIANTNYKADGYCEETNTIYEFHGDLWHGNPKIFNPEIISYFGKTYGELYQKTLEREEQIKDLGYNLIVMWEHDWKKINKSIITLQRKIKSLR